MGSFNSTCALSKTPIIPDQSVRLMFIVANYPNNLLIGYPMKATYDDYGKFKIHDDELANFTLERINQYYMPNRVAEGKKNRIIISTLRKSLILIYFKI